MAEYTKLSDLVGKEFTVIKSFGYKWKQWDNTAKRMLVSDTYEQGYRKIYSFETDKGVLDLGSGQVGTLLEAVFKNGESKLINQTFAVKSNGKTGKDIRYYFNPVKKEVVKEDTVHPSEDSEPVDLSEIPF